MYYRKNNCLYVIFLVVIILISAIILFSTQVKNLAIVGEIDNWSNPIYMEYWAEPGAPPKICTQYSIDLQALQTLCSGIELTHIKRISSIPTPYIQLFTQTSNGDLIILTVSQDKTVIISYSSEENMHYTYWKANSEELYTSLLVELDS